MKSDDISSFFLMENLKIVLIVVGSFLIGSVIMFYVFSKLIRYREKYKEHQSKIVDL